MLHRISDLIRYASDASPYRYLPRAVVVPRTAGDVRAILGYCARTGRHATFRAGRASLNGQSQSGGILIDVRRHWNGMAAEDGGARLRGGAGPGAGPPLPRRAMRVARINGMNRGQSPCWPG